MKKIKKIFCIIIALVTISCLGGIHISAASMSTSESGLSLIKGFEGCRLTAYKALSTEKYYTIGYGHYGSDVYAGMTITQSQAEAMLKNDLKKYEGYVNTFLNNHGISVMQNQFDALVSFTYNLGNVWVSTPEFQLKTYLINGVGNYSNEQITTAFTNWCKSGGIVVQGLVTRRKKEAEYFLAVNLNPIPDNIDHNYVQPINVTAGHKCNTYDQYGNVESGRYIDQGDNCYIEAVYTNGFVKIEYPTPSGNRQAYAKRDDFDIPKKTDPINQTVDTSYQTPYECEPIADSGLITVYNVYGIPYSTSVHNIAHNDWCTVHEVYTSGYCKVTYPTSSGTYTEYAKISDFDIPIKHEHSYGAWIITKSATCTSEGQETRTCSICGESETRIIAALGHKYTTKIISPTFTEQGYDLHTCSECGDSYKDNYTAVRITESVSEVVILQKYLTKKCDITDEQFSAADLNNDGKVNVFDVVILKRRILRK